MDSLSQEVLAELGSLEEDLWRDETRFDQARMRQVMAEDFVEFGMSGCVYELEDVLAHAPQQIGAVLPLPNFQIRPLSENVAQTTYNSVVTQDGVTYQARRSSIWSRDDGTWRLRFHQGTPYQVGAQ